MPINSHQQTFFYRLLMSSEVRYRIARHCILYLAVAAISFNQIYMGFMGYHEVLEDKMYSLTLFIIATYLLLGYFNIYVLIPRLLVKEKFLSYFIAFFISVALFVIIHFGLEHAVFVYYKLKPGIFSYFSKTSDSPFLLELVASFLVNCIAIAGVSFTVILKYWLINDNQVHELEDMHTQSEVAKLKEQVNPQFLFSILRKVGSIVEEEQAKASDMLMDLSEVLRYELYDCNRENVLLNAEVTFIRNYLQLEKSHYGEMDFDITIKGDPHSVLIPPLLFLPLVQYAVRKGQQDREWFKTTLAFEIEEDSVSFSCSCQEPATLKDEELGNIQLRLDRLYGQRYQLQIVNTEAPILHLRINFSEP